MRAAASPKDDLSGSSPFNHLRHRDVHRIEYSDVLLSACLSFPLRHREERRRVQRSICIGIRALSSVGEQTFTGKVTILKAGFSKMPRPAKRQTEHPKKRTPPRTPRRQTQITLNRGARDRTSAPAVRGGVLDQTCRACARDRESARACGAGRETVLATMAFGDQGRHENDRGPSSLPALAVTAFRGWRPCPTGAGAGAHDEELFVRDARVFLLARHPRRI